MNHTSSGLLHPRGPLALAALNPSHLHNRAHPGPCSSNCFQQPGERYGLSAIQRTELLCNSNAPLLPLLPWTIIAECLPVSRLSWSGSILVTPHSGTLFLRQPMHHEIPQLPADHAPPRLDDTSSRSPASRTQAPASCPCCHARGPDSSTLLQDVPWRALAI